MQRKNPERPSDLDKTIGSLLAASKDKQLTRFQVILVPSMLLASSMIMALAWLGHLKYKQELSFAWATLFAWLLVLPEYALNIGALRLGYRKYTGGQMGAFNLATGVVCVTIVSYFVLGEQLSIQKLIGFAIMMIAMILISKLEPNES